MSAFSSALRYAHIVPGLTVYEFLHSSRHPELDEENARTWLSSPQVRANARRLALDVFAPIRELVGPLLVTSGFRCPTLNRAVGGSGSRPGQKPSAHMDGRALDVWPLRMSLLDAMEKILAFRDDLPFEKVIWEQGSWLHLQAPRHAEPAKRQALMWFGGSAYPPFAADDPRVTARAA